MLLAMDDERLSGGNPSLLCDLEDIASACCPSLMPPGEGILKSLASRGVGIDIIEGLGETVCEVWWLTRNGRKFFEISGLPSRSCSVKAAVAAAASIARERRQSRGR